MSKNICISGYYGFDNFGDEIILKILVQNLKTLKNIEKITVFSVNPILTAKNLGINSINSFNIIDVIVSILKCDYLISGGGSLLQDATSRKSLIYYLFIISMAVLFRKKFIIFAQGIGPINNNFLKNLTMLLLKQAYYITVRDNDSFNLLKKYKIKNVEKCFDPAWNIDINVAKADNKNIIGVQLRSFSLITDDFLYVLAKNVNEYYQNKEIHIISLQNELDYDVCLKFNDILKKINPKIKTQVIKNTSNDKVIKDICKCEALISMRYHACLIAVKAGIKLLPINYDIKIKNLSKEFNLPLINQKSEIDNVFKFFIGCNQTNYNKEKTLYYNFDKLKKKIN